MLVLSDLPGMPLRDAVLASDEEACRRAGAAIATWHRAWAGRKPAALREHTIELELGVLIDARRTAPHARSASGSRLRCPSWSEPGCR